jgi:hypothetical protein
MRQPLMLGKALMAPRHVKTRRCGKCPFFSQVVRCKRCQVLLCEKCRQGHLPCTVDRQQ